MKDLKTLTLDEAKEILEYYYPNKTDLSNSKNYEYWVTGLSFESVKNEDGNTPITFGGRLIVGILYHDSRDNCILHFNDTKVVAWLYSHGYDIGELLEQNKYLSAMESDFDSVVYWLSSFSKWPNHWSEDFNANFTLEWVAKKSQELLEKYYYKDYE